MGGKREVPPFLRKVLTWDVKVTEQLHFAFVKTFGPLKKHETSLRALEVRMSKMEIDILVYYVSS